MADSLSAHQISLILDLGAWRDEGRRFEVGKDGEVFKHHEVQKENLDGYSRQRTAGRQRASAPSTSAAPEPSGEDRRKTLRCCYSRHFSEVSDYYPFLTRRQAADGVWAIVQSFPLGRDGPAFWICLFLPESQLYDPMAFAFAKISPLVRPVGQRHTNFPEASICAFSADDDAWRPGDSPLVLLNLYAEWLICQLYYGQVGFWPGRQSGIDAVYRRAEFKPEEWCFCDSGVRYGECHMKLDRAAAARLHNRGELCDHGPRKVPSAVIRFAKSRWKRIPSSSDLQLHYYTGLPPRE